jgi:uncharacterized protein (TIRG00374 family)
VGERAVTLRRNWQVLLGYVLSALALLWVFHDVDLRSIIGQIRSMKTWWLIPAVVCHILSYVCEATRWRLLLPPGQLSFWRAIRATYAGLFTNELMPLRAGELVRAYLASRWMGRPITTLIPSLAIGRLIDGAWLTTGIAFLLVYVSMPPVVAEAARLFSAAVVVLLTTFILLTRRPALWVQRWSEQSGSHLGRVCSRLLLDVASMKLDWRFAAAALFSLALLLFQAASFWFVMAACSLPLGYFAAIGVLVIVNVGTMIPNAPGNVGSFQFFTVLGLQLLGTEKNTAAAFSVILFAVLTLPLWLLGLAAVWRSGQTFAQLTRISHT